jgi:glycosyltransferase involved in cell wall biosynthesis
MKVSILMLAYNHEKYIAQAIESAITQQTSFDYELVIGEDCSKDKTRQIASEYQEKFPELIRLLPSQENLGPSENFIRTYKACRGEWIAILEGDDYWTSTNKLQKQVEFLERHPDCVICFHNIVPVNFSGAHQLTDRLKPVQKEISSLPDIVERNFITNCSVMYRQGFIDQSAGWLEKFTFGDWFVHIVNAQHGNIGYIDEVMAAYRKHSAGAYSGLSFIKELQRWIIEYDLINKFLDYRFDAIVTRRKQEYWSQLKIAVIELGFEAGMLDPSIENVEQIFAEFPPNLEISEEWHKEVLIGIYERLLFLFYSASDISKSRYCWLKLMKYSPAHLRNRGVLKIGASLLRL